MNTNDTELLRAVDHLPEYLRELTFTIASSLDVDLGMAMSTLLSGMASGAHGVKAVLQPDGGVENLSLFHVVLSGPTTGKTRTHKLVHRAHNEHDLFRYEAHQESKRAGSVAQPLRDVIQPLTNSRVLLEVLEGVGQATALSSHDAHSVLNSYFFRQQLGVATLLWDSDGKIVLPCTYGERLIALNASLNLLLMTQPDIFGQHLEKRGATTRSIGFLPRCLFTLVPGISSGFNGSRSGSDTCLAEFYKDVTAYLEEQHGKQKAGRIERALVRFSPSAELLWHQLHRQCKEARGVEFPWIQEAMNRAMQNVTRLAGVIHAYFPHRPGDTRIKSAEEEGAANRDEISVPTLNAAWALGQWYLSQFRQVFPPKPLPLPPPLKPSAHDKHLKRILEDADTIMLHFGLYCRYSGESSAPQSAVLARAGLYSMRFHSALAYLTDQKYLVVEGAGRKARLRPGGNIYVSPNLQRSIT